MARGTWLALTALIMLGALSPGCLQDLDDPSSSFSSIPAILMDHDPSEDVSKVYLMSVLSHVRYVNATLRITESGDDPVEDSARVLEVRENYTYCVSITVNFTAFTIRAEASTGDREFYMEVFVLHQGGEDELYRISVEPPEDQPLAEPDQYEIERDDLPWKKTLTERPRQNA